MKKLLTMLLVLAMVFALIGCGGTQSQSESESAPAETGTEIEPLTIHLYNAVPGEVVDKAIADFASIVSERSNGVITCEITPAGTLGAERETSQLILMGDLDMSIMSIDALDWLVPDVGMSWVCLPGLLNTWEEVDEYYNNGWMFQRHKEVAAEHGIDLICPGEFGLKVLLGTGEPVDSMEDLKGLIIRVPDVDFHHSYFQKLGAMPISGINMYTGLQQGTMDAVHNNIPASEVFKLQEVIDWILLTWDMYGTNYWLANGDFSEKLSDAQREIIYDACEETAANIRETWRGTASSWLEMCKKDPSITVNEISPEMKAEMQKAGYEVWEEYRDKFDPVAMDRIFEEFYPEQ